MFEAQTPEAIKARILAEIEAGRGVPSLGGGLSGGGGRAGRGGEGQG